MSWVNYHSHCHYCDGAKEPEAYVIAAIEQGVAAYGFSSHAPVPFINKWAMDPIHRFDYVKEVERLKIKYQDQIQVYLSLEVDYLPGVMGPEHKSIREMNLDYTIGSIHFIDEFSDGTPWEIDGVHKVFTDGLEKIFDNNIRMAIERYYELTRWMVMLEPPDIVGHLDKIKMQNVEDKFFSEEERWYREAVFKTLKSIANSNRIVEINTRGVYKGATQSAYPSPWILDYMRELKIPVTLNSDAHHPREITAGFKEASQLLTDVGYKKLTVFYNNQWIEVDFDATGLDLPQSSMETKNIPI